VVIATEADRTQRCILPGQQRDLRVNVYLRAAFYNKKSRISGKRLFNMSVKNIGLITARAPSRTKIPGFSPPKQDILWEYSCIFMVSQMVIMGSHRIFLTKENIEKHEVFTYGHYAQSKYHSSISALTFTTDA